MLPMSLAEFPSPTATFHVNHHHLPLCLHGGRQGNKVQCNQLNEEGREKLISDVDTDGSVVPVWRDDPTNHHPVEAPCRPRDITMPGGEKAIKRLSPRAESDKEKNSSAVGNNNGPGVPLPTSWYPAKDTKKTLNAQQLGNG